MFSVIPPTGVPFDWKFVFGDFADKSEGFDSFLTQYLGGKTFLTNSGKSALFLILSALKKRFPDKNEVIIPNYTCWSLPSAIVRAGLRIRPVDIDVSTLTVNPSALSMCINDKSCAVIVPHLFGIPGDVVEIERMCEENQLFLIDDAAQGLGATQHNRKIGSCGGAGILSFGRGKTITSQAGGAAIIRDKEIADIANLMFDEAFAQATTSSVLDKSQMAAYKLLFNRFLYWIPDSLPFLKLGETIYDTGFEISRLARHRARWGLEMFNSLEEIVEGRRKIAKMYVQFLDDAGLDHVMTVKYSDEAAYLRFPIVFRNKAARRYILQKGHRLGMSKMYPGTVDSIGGISNHLAAEPTACVESHRIADGLVTLPTHFGIRESDVRNIVRLVIETHNELEK